MSLPVKTGLPVALDLPAGWKIRFTARDASSGAELAGVLISNASIMAASVGPPTAELATGDWVLVPGPE